MKKKKAGLTVWIGMISTICLQIKKKKANRSMVYIKCYHFVVIKEQMFICVCIGYLWTDIKERSDKDCLWKRSLVADSQVGERLSFHYTVLRTSHFCTMGIVTSGTLENFTLLQSIFIFELLYYHLNKMFYY